MGEIPTKTKAPTNAEELPTGQSLGFYEAVIERGRPNLENVASALFEIHQSRLYRKSYNSFKDYLHQRWKMSRARGYQLIKFAKLRQVSSAVDTSPINEREARAWDPNGSPSIKPNPDLTSRAMSYVAKAFKRLEVSARAQFIEEMRKLLGVLGQILEQTKPELSSSPYHIEQHQPTQPEMVIDNPTFSKSL